MIVELATWFIFGYFVLLNGSYLALNFLSLVRLQRDNRAKLLDDLPQIYSGLEPAISVLMPAFNEQASIAGAVRSMLQLSY